MDNQENRLECLQEDEIDLRELWATVMKYKREIVKFSAVITLLALVYALSIPNSYKSHTLLSPQEQAKPSLGGELAALAGMAGVSLGGGSADASTSLETFLKDYDFNKMVIEKHGLVDRISGSAQEKNMVFAFGFGGIHWLLSGSDSQDDKVNQAEKVYGAFKALQGIMSLSSDKKTGLITLSATAQDRFLAKELVEIYLKELTTYLKQMEIKEVLKKIKFYKQELVTTNDIQLKTQISSLLGSLVQKRVLSNSNEFYVVSQMIAPRVAHVSEKTKPKRSLILILAMIMSLMVGVFGAFFKEFLDKSRQDAQ